MFLCKMNNKRRNVIFDTIFYVSKCFLNLMNFKQLNILMFFMTYNSKQFVINTNNIIAKKRDNNVCFFEL